MKRIVFFLALTFSMLFGQIDEYKTDIYFGNGVWNSIDEARISREILQKKIEQDIIKGDSKLAKKYGTVYLAYNRGRGAMNDVLETFYQLKAAGQVNTLDFFAVVYAITMGNLMLSAEATLALTTALPTVKEPEQNNVDEMLKQYQETSFSKSHRVLLVSHSQGNLFANRVYASISPNEYKDYFANVQVATPANAVLATNGSHITLFGDPVINPIPGSLPSNVSGDAGHAFVEAYLDQEAPYNKLMFDIKQFLSILDTTLSQWSTKDESGYGTRDYRIKVEHRFDKSMVVNDDVYPFAPSKKLYYVDASQQSHINGYVKGGYGGEAILDAKFHSWENQLNTQFYKLEGTQPPEYITGGGCPDSSLYEITSHQNIGTKEWRVSVKNKETNTTTDGVYPFNLNGSLYQLDSGEWVMASCGGTAIESSWSGQESYEVYRLKGTDEKMYKLQFELVGNETKTYPYSWYIYSYSIASEQTFADYYVRDMASAYPERLRYDGITISLSDGGSMTTPKINFFYDFQGRIIMTQATYDYIYHYLEDNDRYNIREIMNNTRRTACQRYYDNTSWLVSTFNTKSTLILNYYSPRFYEPGNLVVRYDTSIVITASTEAEAYKHVEIFKRIFPSCEVVHKMPKGTYGM